MKTVAVPAGATAEFSNSVLVGSIEPQTRWNLGGLCSSLLAYSSVALALVLRSGAQGSMSLFAVESPAAGFDGTTLEGLGPDLLIQRGPGTSKSRPVVIPIPSTLLTPSSLNVGGQAADLDQPLDAAIFTLLGGSPNAPVLTLLGVMNRLEAYLDTLDPGWGLVVDQDSESIYLFNDVLSEGAIKTAFDTAADGLTRIAEFTLAADETTEVIPGYGWE